MLSPVPNVVPFGGPPTALPANTMGMSNGIMSAVSKQAIDSAARDQAEKANAQPLVTGLAGHIRKAWDVNKREKDRVEDRMLAAIRQRRGEYEPQRLAQIREQGGSEIYMMISAAKARTISAWLREILMAKGSEKPWTLAPTPLPELPPERAMTLMQSLQGEMQALVMSGQPIDMQGMMESRKADLLNQLKEEAREITQRMETYMEDQLVEGGFMRALSQFIDDLTTFPAAIVEGPVIRNKGRLQWRQDPMDPTQWTVAEEKSLQPEWERIDPFKVYPSPGSETPDEGDFIVIHDLRRNDLHSMIGVDGYSEDAIRAVLEEHGRGGLREWTALDSERATAEGRESHADNPSGIIQAIRYWGSVRGQDLIDWGLEESQVEDALGEYEVEAWLIGKWVIKAIINPDLLGRRPYCMTSWEKLPGLFWGQSPMDQMRDMQAMCNAAARAIANNMGISSGPQVWVNIDRIPIGEDITNLYPWKIHQTTTDPMGGSSPPIGFFQPQSNAAELMAIYEKFSSIADDVTGVPRYMGGEAPGGGIGRTSTGMSMLMTAAGKNMQQAVALIDLEILSPLLERLYYHNMKFADDPSIKGDVRVQARGSSSLAVKESLQVRRNEFLQATNNPTDLQITGLEGRATVLREQAKSLDLNVDRIVPDPEVLKARQMVMQAQQMAQASQAGPAPNGTNVGSGQQLGDGSETADNFNAQPSP